MDEIILDKGLLMSARQRLESYRTLLTSIDKHWQQLVAIEIGLQEMRASKSINREQFRKRSQKVQSMKQKLKSMRQQLQTEKILQENAKQFDLPNLEKCRSLERGVIEDYFNEKFKVIHDTYQSLTIFLPWVDDAVRRRYPFWAIFRLAKIKHYMGRLKSEQNKLNLDIQLQEKLLNKLVHILGNGTHKANTLRSVLETFEQEESLNQKISQLEQKIQKKKQEIYYMKNWLRDAREKLRKKNLPKIPQADELASLAKRFKIYDVDKLNRSRERLNLAETYINSYVKKFANWDDRIPPGV